MTWLDWDRESAPAEQFRASQRWDAHTPCTPSVNRFGSRQAHAAFAAPKSRMDRPILLGDPNRREDVSGYRHRGKFLKDIMCARTDVWPSGEDDVHEMEWLERLDRYVETMQTFFKLDLHAGDQQVRTTVIAQDEITAEFGELLDAAFTNVAVIVNAQGFSTVVKTAALAITAVVGDDAIRTRRYDMLCSNCHPSVWRVLDGLLHAFDVASMPLVAVHFEGDGNVVEDDRILKLDYVGARADHRLQLQREESAGMERSVEVKLVAGIPPEARQAIESGLAAWLDLCAGGFFANGEHPVTSAHDCPGFVEVGSHLLVARFEGFLSTEAAFDVLVNVLGHWHSQWGVILLVRIY